MDESQQAAGGKVTLRDPAERTRKGVELQTQLLAAVPPEPGTPFEASWRDYAFAEVWSRAGLDRRSRFLITLASLACAGAAADVLDGYVRGALRLADLTLTELREAVLHFAVYGGWSRAARIRCRG